MARRRVTGPVTVEAAVDMFVSSPDFSLSTRRSYRQTLERLGQELGSTRSMRTVTGTQLDETLRRLWGRRMPATWNRHVATTRSFVAFCKWHRWMDDSVTVSVDRRRERVDHTRCLTVAEVERLWGLRDVGLRERTLWRLLYETAARASEILGLNVEDVDVANKRAVVRAKGGDVEFVFFQAGAARLLPRLINGRTRGPLFLTDLRPPPGRTPAAVDACPHTGRARLSYRRAEEIFVEATGGWTLHQLRHSAITHLAEANVSLPLLMAKSRHASLRSLERYARPGPGAVAALTAAHDPSRRRRHAG